MTTQDTLNAMEAGEVKLPLNSRVRPDPCAKCSNTDCAKKTSTCIDRLFYAHELLPWLEYSLMATVEELNRIHRLKTEARLKFEAEIDRLQAPPPPICTTCGACKPNVCPIYMTRDQSCPGYWRKKA